MPFRAFETDVLYQSDVEDLLKHPQASAEAWRQAVRQRGVDLPIGLTTHRGIDASWWLGAGSFPPVTGSSVCGQSLALLS